MKFSAQTVSASFFNLPQQWVYLNAYTGLYMEVMDSVFLSYDGRVDFNTPMKKGMYQIETEYGNSIDFLYEDDAVSFVLRDINKPEEIEFINSQLNTNWYAYLNEKEEVVKSLNLLKVLLRDYDAESEFYKNTKKEYQNKQMSFKSFTDSLINNYDNYASTLIKVDRFPVINLGDDYKKQREDIIANYFNGVDFNDLSLIPTNVLTTKIIDFLSVQQSPGNDYNQQIFAIILGIDNVLYRATVNYEMYKFVFQFLIEGFKELSYNEIVDYMCRLPYLEEIDATSEQYDEMLSIVEYNSRVKIGTAAPNISGTTVLNDDFNLYDIDSEFTVVFFWSYGCAHCVEIISDLQDFMKNNTDFSLVAIAVDGPRNKIKNIAKRFKDRAYFYHDGLSWQSQIIDDYAVSATPTIFILDKDKKILYKPFDFKEFVQFVNILRK